jgi:hypothetical protein
MQLLQDTFIIEQLQVLSEGKDNGPVRIRGVFGRCNEKNNNGRIYPTSVLESQLAKVKPLISERRLCGELDHPANDTVKLSNASHLITKLDMKGDELIGEAELLRTPAGLTAKALVEGGVKIGISSRGMGTLSEDHNGDKIVNEDFRLVTFDLVADPSTRGAYPGMCESVESKFVKDSQSKLTKESNFVTMLNSKMRDAYKPFLEENSGMPTPKQIRKSEVIDTTTPEGKARVAALLAQGATTGKPFDPTKKKPAKKKIADAFELVKADGHWHRIADAIAEGFGKKKVDEAFADEIDKAKDKESATNLHKKEPHGDTGSMLSNFRAKRHAKGMEVAKAKGARKGAKILAKGDVEADRIRARGKAGGSVSMNPFGAGSEGFAKKTGNLEKTKARQDRTSAKLKNKLKDLEGKTKGNDSVAKNDPVDKKPVVDPVNKNIGDGGPVDKKPVVAPVDKKPVVAPVDKKPVVAPVDKKPVQPKRKRKSDTEIDAQRADSTAKSDAAVADVKRRAGNKSATSASFEKTGSFGAGVSDKTTDKFDLEASRKSIARREKKTGKNVKQSPEQAAKLERKAYKQIGSMLAEMFNLKEEKKPVTPETQLGGIRRNKRGENDQGNPAPSPVGQTSLGHDVPARGSKEYKAKMATLRNAANDDAAKK